MAEKGNENELERNDKGQFVEGTVPNPNGRPVGSKNKYTLAKELIVQTLIDRQHELKGQKLGDILKFISATSPKETKIEVDGPITIKWKDKDDS